MMSRAFIHGHFRAEAAKPLTAIDHSRNQAEETGFETGAADPRFGVEKTPHSKGCSIADRCLVGAVSDRGPEHRPRRGESC
jgi:hypothetical protein